MSRNGSRLRAITGMRRGPAHGLASDASLRLGATLDLAGTGERIVEIAVPEFADAASVFVLERLAAGDRGERPDEGQLVVRRLAAGFARPGPFAESHAFPAGEIIAFCQDTPYARCVATNSPVRFAEPDGPSLMRAARSPGGQATLAAYSSFLSVPLTARGVVQGFLGFARAAGRFSDKDVTLARELSAMAAVSIDNALLYGREQSMAEALQRGLLPGDLPTPDGVEVAHRYRPPSGQIIGGDWSDLVPLPDGRSVLIVGDAMGHGADAAAVMAQLRAAANALAGLDLPPGTVLRRLDEMASRLNSATFATCVYAVLDPAAGSCLITAAGHLPPVLTLPDGLTEVIDVPACLPLGLGAETHAAVEVPLPPGAILALYTDGLVESRVRSFDEGIVALAAALAATLGAGLPSRHVPLPGLCDAVLDRLCGPDDGRGEDDTTLVLARIPSLPVPRSAADDL